MQKVFYECCFADVKGGFDSVFLEQLLEYSVFISNNGIMFQWRKSRVLVFEKITEHDFCELDQTAENMVFAGVFLLRITGSKKTKYGGAGTCSTILGFLRTRNAQQKNSSKYHIFRSLVELTKIMLSNFLKDQNPTFSSLEHDAIIRDENTVLQELFQEDGIETTFHISKTTFIKDFLHENLQLIYSNPQNSASPLKNFEEKDRLVAAWCSYLLLRKRR